MCPLSVLMQVRIKHWPGFMSSQTELCLYLKQFFIFVFATNAPKDINLVSAVNTQHSLIMSVS